MLKKTFLIHGGAHREGLEFCKKTLLKNEQNQTLEY